MISQGESQNSSPTGKSPQVRRRRWGKILLVALCGIAVWAWWYNGHRTLSWRDTLSPSYWWRQWSGNNLYDEPTAFLMHGNPDLPEIALTFDDGPHPESRPKILAILKQYNVHATFFDVGKHLSAHPDLVRQTLAEGHEIANHSQNHFRLPPLSPDQRHREINDVDISFCRITGKHLQYLRPPGMRYDDAVLADTKRLGYIVVGYTTVSDDYQMQGTPDDIAQRTLSRVGKGGIVLLHDLPETAAALPQILDELKRRKLRGITVSELIAHLPEKSRLPAQAFLQKQAE
jgi:peptidoglycan-N-acetylglucosamine deacetylase